MINAFAKAGGNKQVKQSQDFKKASMGIQKASTKRAAF